MSCRAPEPRCFVGDPTSLERDNIIAYLIFCISYAGNHQLQLKSVFPVLQALEKYHLFSDNDVKTIVHS